MNILFQKPPQFGYNMKKGGVLKEFQLPYFEYFQIWLNIIMDDHHLNNITKLRQNNNNNT
jgi:hypothetical protein